MRYPEELARLQAENLELRAQLAWRSSVRSWLAILLVVLTSISTTSGAVAVWVHNSVFDSDRFMTTIGPALDDPAFYSAVSARVSEEVLVALNLETRVTARLSQLDEYLSEALIDALEVGDRGRELLSRFERPTLADLAPPIVDGLEDRVVGIVDGVITSAEFREQFPLLVERLHQAGVALVRGDSASLPNVYTEGGEVRLNLVPTIVEALRAVIAELRAFLPDVSLPDVVSNQVDAAIEQLATAVVAELPEEFGQVTIMSEQDLTDLQSAAKLIDRLVWAIVALALILLVTTIAVSPTRRRTVAQIGLGVIAGLIVAWPLIGQIESTIQDRVTSLDGTQAVSAVFAGLFGSLRAVWLTVGAVAILGVLVAYLAGRPQWLDRATNWATAEMGSDAAPTDFHRWVADHYDTVRIVGGAVAAVATLFIGLKLVPLIVVLGLLSLYLWWAGAMRHRALGASESVEEVRPESQPAPRAEGTDR